MGLSAATSLKDNFPLISFPSQKGLNSTRGDLPPRAVKVIKKIPRLTSYRKTNGGKKESLRQSGSKKLSLKPDLLTHRDYFVSDFVI